MSTTMEASCYGCERYIFFFAINKYKGPHTCGNPCLNRDHQILDSNLVATHIKAIIKAQFALLVVVVQATVMEKFRYEYHTRRYWLENIKHLQTYLGPFITYMHSCHISS